MGQSTRPVDLSRANVDQFIALTVQLKSRLQSTCGNYKVLTDNDEDPNDHFFKSDLKNRSLFSLRQLITFRFVIVSLPELPTLRKKYDRARGGQFSLLQVLQIYWGSNVCSAKMYLRLLERY